MNPVLMRVTTGVAWIVSVVSVWASPKTFAAEPARVFGSLQMSAEHSAIGRDAGWRVAVVPVSWDRFEPKPGVFDENYIRELARKMSDLRKLGYKLQMDPGVQYPPAWVFELPQGRYKNQFGDLFVSKEPGMVDVVLHVLIQPAALPYSYHWQRNVLGVLGVLCLVTAMYRIHAETAKLD